MVTESIVLPVSDTLWRSISVGSEGVLHIVSVVNNVVVKTGIDSESSFHMHAGDTLTANETIYVRRATAGKFSTVVVAR